VSLLGGGPAPPGVPVILTLVASHAIDSKFLYECNCLSSAMHSIGQTIKSRKRPSSVDKIVTLFMDRSSPNLEHGFPILHTEINVLSSSIRMRMRDH